MKKLIILLSLIAFSVFAQDSTATDSIKINDLKNRVELSESAFVDLYLSVTGKEINQACVNLYIDNKRLANLSEFARLIIIDIINAKDFEEIRAILRKNKLIKN